MRRPQIQNTNFRFISKRKHKTNCTLHYEPAIRDSCYRISVKDLSGPSPRARGQGVLDLADVLGEVGADESDVEGREAGGHIWGHQRCDALLKREGGKGGGGRKSTHSDFQPMADR